MKCQSTSSMHPILRTSLAYRRAHSLLGERTMDYRFNVPRVDADISASAQPSMRGCRRMKSSSSWAARGCFRNSGSKATSAHNSSLASMVETAVEILWTLSEQLDRLERNAHPRKSEVENKPDLSLWIRETL